MNKTTKTIVHEMEYDYSISIQACELQLLEINDGK
jgi:hypothetical protein